MNIFRPRNSDDYISDLSVSKPGASYKLSWKCPNDKSSFIVCVSSAMSKRPGAAEIGALHPSIESRLFMGSSVLNADGNGPRFLLQFVSNEAFIRGAHGTDIDLAGKKLYPPLLFQVWVANQNDTCVFIPEDNEECSAATVPLKIGWYVRSVGTFVYKYKVLTLEYKNSSGDGLLDEPFLWYSVDGCRFPCPIPKSVIGLPIRLNINRESNVDIIVSKRYKNAISLTRTYK